MNKDDCMAQHMRELKDTHADWSHEQMVAVALKKCGESDKAMKELTIKKGLLLSEQEVNYVPLSTTKGKACANCRFFCALGSDEGDGDLDNDCLIVEDDAPGAQPILPTGYCDRWEALPAPAENTPAPIPVTIVEPDEMTMNMEQKPATEDGLFNRIWERIQSTLATPEKEQQAFTVFKTADGKDHWIARYTNNFKDRDDEIISEKALSDYVTRVNMGVVPKPELWDWHTKGTRHGQADDVFGIGHFVYAIGHYDDSEIGKQAAAYDRKHAKDIALSHGFTAPKWSFKDGIYEVANTFEITKLPKGRESNPYTKFEEIQKMELTAERESHLRKIYDSKIVDEIKAEAEKHGKALEALEVAYKDFPAVTPAVVKEQESSTAAMLLELTKAQGDMATLLVEISKARKAEKEAFEAALTAEKQTHQKAIEGFTAEVSELRKAVNAGPRAASQDSTTTVGKVEVDALKAKAPNADSKTEQYQAFMGLPVSPVTGVQ